MPILVDAALPDDVLSCREQPALVSEGLILRPWTTSDADAVISAFTDPAIQRWHLRRIDSEAEAVTWIDQWASGWEANTDASWAVTDQSSKRVLGYVSLRGVFPVAALAQVSFSTLAPFRQRGVASVAVQAMAEWAFDSVRLHRLYLTHSTENRASCRVAERAGFVIEGTLRQYMMHTDGWHDVHMHARLSDDN